MQIYKKWNLFIARLFLLVGLVALMGVPGKAQTVFAKDLFAGAADSFLSAHTGATPQSTTWTTVSGLIQLTGTGAVRPGQANPCVSTASNTPSQLDYDVTADFTCLALPASNLVTVEGRFTGASACYGFSYWAGGGGWSLYRNGTPVASSTTPAITTGHVYHVMLSMRGAVITCTVADGAGSAINPFGTAYTDSAPITTIGQAALYLYGVGTYTTDTDNIVVSNFAATTPATVATLTLGTATATTGAGGITVSLPVSGGTTPFSVSWFRGTTPVVATTGTPYTTGTGSGSTLTVTDSTLTPGTVYYYAAKVVDSTTPSTQNATTPHVVAMPAVLTGLTVGWLGDSITAGTTSSNAGTKAAPVIAGNILATLPGVRVVTTYNQGVGGTKAADWQPGGTNYLAFKAAVPAGVNVIHIMLGTNDSAGSGGNGQAASTYKAYMKNIIDQLLLDFTSAKIFISYSIFFSPNTNGGGASVYNENSLTLITTGYYPAIDQLIIAYTASNPGRVYAGDKFAYRFFAKNYLTEMTGESGVDGIYYLHPNDLGYADLGNLWAIPIYNVLFGTAVPKGGSGAASKGGH